MIKALMFAVSVAIALSGARASADISPSVKEWLEAAACDESIVVWVFFRDKGERSPAETEARIREAGSLFEPAAIARRQRARPYRPFDQSDLRLHKPYIRTLEEEGVKFRSFSRWLNAVSIEATPQQVARIADLGFVTCIRRVSGRRGGPDLELSGERPRRSGSLDQYGQSYRQLEQMQVTDLHAEGFTGSGVIVAIFDTGFWLEHESLSGLNLIAQHDFINDDDQTANEPGDPIYQHNHGTSCLSLLAGNSPGILVGAAYDAGYILAKTEDVSMEEPIEEDWWIEAAEWADSLGAQIITSSLCYKDWYTYEDMDGDTAPITIAADRAVLNGIVVTNAAGNSGASEWRYIIAPADGDSVISVGSVDSTGNRSYWCSQGPTYDGRIKPTIMAMGQATYLANADAVDSYGRGSGTSFATPLAAGAVALILQKNPTCTASDVIDAVMATGTMSTMPDTLYGWGILQAHDASDFVLSGLAAGKAATVRPIVYPNPCSALFYIESPEGVAGHSGAIYDIAGRLIGEFEVPRSGAARVDVGTLLPKAAPGILFVEVRGAGRAKVLILR